MNGNRATGRKMLARIVVFLLLGAIVNVAVAWGAMWLDPPPHPFSGAYHREPLDDPGGLLQNMLQIQKVSRSVCGGNVYQGRGWREVTASCFTDETAVTKVASVSIYEAGWPLMGLHGRLEEQWIHTRLVGLIDRAAATLPLSMHHEYIPCMPRWPGFAVNTILYAVALWMLFAMPFVLRRKRRIKRGLCPACAYPIGTSDVCTECGAALRSMGRRV